MNDSKRPAWLAPAVVVAVILALFLGGRKNEDVVENPLVDLAVITVGVFAFAAGFRWAAGKANAPGLATFFGAAPAASGS